MVDRKQAEELIVITKTYDFILWSCNHTGKFPRNHRFVLGEKIERTLYNRETPANIARSSDAAKLLYFSFAAKRHRHTGFNPRRMVGPISSAPSERGPDNDAASDKTDNVDVSCALNRATIIVWSNSWG